MEPIFLICALVGGTVMVCQFVLSMLGHGDHHEVGGHDFHDVGDHEAGDHDDHAGTEHNTEHETGHSWFVGVLTLRTIVAALTVFGLTGMAGKGPWESEPMLRLIVAVAAGAGAMFLVAGLMRSLYRLKADGTVRIDRAVGKSGTVYLTIPGQRAGTGKILLNVQNRTMEYQAITSAGELPTGANIIVLAVLGPDTVEVASATPSKRTTHV